MDFKASEKTAKKERKKIIINIAQIESWWSVIFTCFSHKVSLIGYQFGGMLLTEWAHVMRLIKQTLVKL